MNHVYQTDFHLLHLFLCSIEAALSLDPSSLWESWLGTSKSTLSPKQKKRFAIDCKVRMNGYIEGGSCHLIALLGLTLLVHASHLLFRTLISHITPYLLSSRLLFFCRLSVPPLLSQVSQLMADFWTSFATYCDPNGQLEWNGYRRISSTAR